MELIVKLPRGMKVDACNLPSDFDTQIIECFKDYTEGTSHDYTFCDQLCFIDQCIETITNLSSSYDRADKILEDRILHEWRENGELITEEDLFSTDQMTEMYRKGREEARLYQDYGFLHGSHERDAIQKMMVRIIKVVSCFEWGNKDAT